MESRRQPLQPPAGAEDPSEILRRAVARHQRGDLTGAGSLYQRVLDADPRQPDALHLSGVLAFQTGDRDAAIDAIQAAIQRRPNEPIYRKNLGTVLQAAGRIPEAIAAFRRSLDLKPDFFDAEIGLAGAMERLGQREAALDGYQRCLALRPDAHGVYFRMAATLRALGRIDESVAACREAIRRRPDQPRYSETLGDLLAARGETDAALDAYREALRRGGDAAGIRIKIGIQLGGAGNPRAALTAFQEALRLAPDNPVAHHNAGVALRELGRSREAVGRFQSALAGRPDYAEAHNNLGNAFRDLGRDEEALACYTRAIEIRRNYPDAHNNIGNLLKDRGRISQAIASYERALAIQPDYPFALYNLGNIREEQGQLETAIDFYERALAVRPDFGLAFASLVYLLQYACDWDRLAELGPRLDDLNAAALEKGQRTPETPLANLSRKMDPAENFRIARSWAGEIERNVAARGETFEPRPDRAFTGGRIRVGYLSNDFRSHPVGQLMAGLFAAHDRKVVEVIGYSYGRNDGSVTRDRIAKGCDRFVDIRPLSPEDAARKIHDDGVDILVDLMGHTQSNRMAICAHRPAPVQVSYLGFPGTTGAGFFDYVLTDPILTPPEQAPCYSEALAYLPHCYMVTDDRQPISRPFPRRADEGLPDDAVVFCSFNSAHKIEPVIFDAWMRILRAVPGSVLWLPRRHDVAVRNLRRAAGQWGVSSERLIFADKLPDKADHISRIMLADLALDTRIYNGHATTADLLWMGVPVITLKGRHFASRVAAGLLTGVGLPELVVDRLEDYEAVARSLATHPDRLRRIRQRLAKNRLTTPLFDLPRFVRGLERAYQEMARHYRKGQECRMIHIQPSGGRP